MSIQLFEGPAGAGKTTRLMEEVTTAILRQPLDSDQRVLALTRMHGSRRRLHERLEAVPILRRQFECLTIDSFAARLLRRWRSLARRRFGGDAAGDDYPEVCRRAGILLSEELVGRWVAQAFPIVVLDEMQDSKGGQLALAQGLAGFTRFLAAADAFQDLEGETENLALDWAHRCGQVIALTGNRRTTRQGLLEAARTVREGYSLPENGRGLSVFGVENHNVGAGFVSRTLSWWKPKGDVAILVAARSVRSRFVRELIARVEAKPIGDAQTGPYRVTWETSEETELADVLSKLGLPDDPQQLVSAADPCLLNRAAPIPGLARWFDRQRRLSGRTQFSSAEVGDRVRLIHHQQRALGHTRFGGVRAMTIHQGKNREFDSVIVLWPYEVQGSSERQRRLLYNAITRAKNQVLVVAQGGAGRIRKPPFAA